MAGMDQSANGRIRSAVCVPDQPFEVTERNIQQAGFKLIRREDVTGNIELTSGRWLAARQNRRDRLLKIEGDDRYEGLQSFIAMVYKLSSERRLSRFVFVAEK
jgi:hypothetical protein